MLRRLPDGGQSQICQLSRWFRRSYDEEDGRSAMLMLGICYRNFDLAPYPQYPVSFHYLHGTSLLLTSSAFTLILPKHYERTPWPIYHIINNLSDFFGSGW